MQQAPVNDIASLYRGNPQALQARMQKEPQVAPGIPADLSKLIALNTITNEADAAKRNQVLQQLGQMAPQGPDQMPTVAQSIQQQAQQKLQARMMQEQQQANPGVVPPNTPQPESQPQGIDELPVEFGMAEGGIIAFQSRGAVPRVHPQAELIDFLKQLGLTAEEFTNAPTKVQNEIKDMMRAGTAAVETPAAAAPATAQTAGRGYGLGKGLASLVKAIGPLALADIGLRAGEGLTSGVANAAASSRENREALMATQDPDMALGAAILEQNAKEQEAKPPKPEPYSNEGRTGARPYTPGPVNDLKKLVEEKQRAEQKPPRPAAAAPAPASAPAEQQSFTPPRSDLASEAQNLEVERMRADPMAAEAAKRAMYQSQIGAPDTTQRDAMIKQLQEERERQKGPQDSFGKLMEYLGQVANTPRGLDSFGAGAAGVRAQNAVDEARAQKRFELGSKIIEQEQGKIDASRTYAKETYGVGEKEYDRVYKEKLDAAKLITDSEEKAREMAQREALKMFELRQQERLEREKMRNTAANKPVDYFGRYLELAGSKDPEKQKAAAALLSNIENFNNAKKPGDEKMAAFQRDESVKDLMKRRASLVGLSTPAATKMLGEIEASLKAKAVEYGVAQGTPVESVGAPPPGAVREVKR